MYSFNEPSEGSTEYTRINPADTIGHLMLVWAVGYIEHSPTQYTKPGKNSDVIVVDVIDLDQVGENGSPGLIGRSVWWRQGRLIGSLKDKVGDPNPVLARMMTGVPTKGKPPFLLKSASSDAMAVQRANMWFQANPGFKPEPYVPQVEETVENTQQYTQTPMETFQPAVGQVVGPEHQAALRNVYLESLAQRGGTLPPPAPQQDEEPPF